MYTPVVQLDIVPLPIVIYVSELPLIPVAQLVIVPPKILIVCPVEVPSVLIPVALALVIVALLI